MHPHKDVTKNCNKHPSLQNGYPAVSQAVRALCGWNYRTLNPLTRGRTGDEMKVLSPSAQYLSHYEQNTSAHKKSPQKRAFFSNAWNPLKSRTARGLGFESTWAPCHGPSRFRLSRGCGTWAPPWCQRWRCGHGQWGIHLEKSDQIQPPKSALG